MQFNLNLIHSVGLKKSKFWKTCPNCEGCKDQWWFWQNQFHMGRYKSQLMKHRVYVYVRTYINCEDYHRNLEAWEEAATLREGWSRNSLEEILHNQLPLPCLSQLNSDLRPILPINISVNMISHTSDEIVKKAKTGQQFFTLNFVKYCQSDKQKTTKPVQSALCIQFHTDWLSPTHPSRVYKKDDKSVLKQSRRHFL